MGGFLSLLLWPPGHCVRSSTVVTARSKFISCAQKYFMFAKKRASTLQNMPTCITVGWKVSVSTIYVQSIYLWFLNITVQVSHKNSLFLMKFQFVLLSIVLGINPRSSLWFSSVIMSSVKPLYFYDSLRAELGVVSRQRDLTWCQNTQPPQYNNILWCNLKLFSIIIICVDDTVLHFPHC